MEYEYKKGWWETKDHKRIRIKDMTWAHLVNTINLLKRTPEFYDEVYIGGFCWISSEDFDADYIDNSKLVDKKIKELEDELERRRELYRKDIEKCLKV